MQTLPHCMQLYLKVFQHADLLLIHIYYLKTNQNKILITNLK